MSRPIQTALTRSIAHGTPERALARARAQSDRLTTQLATGLRIQQPSDDPAGYARARDLGRVEARMGQYERGIDAAQTWVDQTQTQLDAMGDLFASAYETGLRAANGIYDADELARQIESIRDEAITRLNAKSGDEYLFAGNETRTAPIDAAGAVATGDFTGSRSREVAPGLSLGINTVGALDIDGASAPDRLQALADAIRLGDQTAIQDAIAGAQAGIDHYAELGGRNGSIARRLDNARLAVETQATVVAEQRAAIEEIDLAEVLGQNQRQQVALEAALRATAASVQTSLLNYLQ